MRLFDVLINFHQPQYKQCKNITYKHGIYEFPQDLANDLRLKILETQEIVWKCLNSIEWDPSAQSTLKIETFVNTSEKLLKNRNWAVLKVRYFTWQLELVSDIMWMIVCGTLCFDSNFPQTFLSLISLTILITLRSLKLL